METDIDDVVYFTNKLSNFLLEFIMQCVFYDILTLSFWSKGNVAVYKDL